jgi:hypothetical protein
MIRRLKIMGKSLFDKIFNAADELKKQLKKPTARNRLKRKLQSAYDHAYDMVMDLYVKLDSLYMDLEKYDINEILDIRDEIKDLKITANAIQLEYMNLFGEEMVCEELPEWELADTIAQVEEEKATKKETGK